VHAIKGGITILETQQNSDITYRVYDYDRLSNGKPRQLHIQQSLDVIKVPAAPLSECMIKTGEAEANKLQKLIECKYYQVFHMKVDGKAEFEQSYPFLIVSVVEGNGLLNHTSVKKGDHFILPYGYGKVEIEGNLEFVASTVSTK
jgi:beta-glucosidase